MRWPVYTISGTLWAAVVGGPELVEGPRRRLRRDERAHGERRLFPRILGRSKKIGRIDERGDKISTRGRR